MHGDDSKLDDLQREVQELRRAQVAQGSKVSELTSDVARVEARMIAISEMIEDRRQHGCQH
jgi:hypothetical protein